VPLPKDLKAITAIKEEDKMSEEVLEYIARDQ